MADTKLTEPSSETDKVESHSQPVSSTSPKANASQSQEITTKILDFLSTASNEKLGACALGLGAATYFVLGRLGLVLIGAVGGIVLHATWEGSSAKDETSLQNEQKRRKELSLDVVKRLLDRQGTQTVAGEDDGSSLVDTGKAIASNFDEFRPETAAALRYIVDRVIDDYVKWWYSPMLRTELSFLQACRRTLTSFLISFSNHLSRKRPEDVFLNFLTNSTSIFIVFLGELSKALMAQTAAGKEPSDAIALYLTDNPDSSFSSVLDRREQERKLKAVSEDILETFLETKAYQFDPARTFLREVLAGLILEPTLVTCSKAEWINGWIVHLLEQGEPEIMNAINAGVGEATGKSVATSSSAQVSPMKQESDKSPAVNDADDEDREALEEVKRLNALLAAEQLKQEEEIRGTPSVAPSTNSILTPTSSYSDLAGSRAIDTPEEGPEPEKLIAEPTSMTSFDQIVPQEQIFVEPAKTIPLTLHKAVVSIFDDAQPGEKSTIRSKPTIDYLLQIEPASSQHPGWMIARKYADFETLHEVLRRISVISGVPEFNIRFAVVPAWKGQTKSALRADLEDYLREALTHARLAESEGMKRFLEKDQGLEKLGSSKGVLGFPNPEVFQSMGKGVLDVLSAAPKGAAGGGKALLDGMKGVGTVFTGQKRSGSRPGQANRTLSTSTLPRMSEDQSRHSESTADSIRGTDESSESIISSRTSIDHYNTPPLPSRPSMEVKEGLQGLSSSSAGTSRVSFQHDPSLSSQAIPEDEPIQSVISNMEDEVLSLPPRPDEIDNEPAVSQSKSDAVSNKTRSVHSLDSADFIDEVVKDKVLQETIVPETLPTTKPKQQKRKSPFTGEETSVAVELIFAVIQELYTLSSAWNIRRTLLNAAKTFLLRPGNPSLEQIRTLLQESVIEANTSDEGIAYQLLKLRENSLPTEEEFAAWPPPLSDEAKEKLRKKARKLLVEQGLPPALRGIMGTAASGEALGRLFDSLQVEEVARGLMFAIMLQSIRAATH